jgi:hypothetical protein
LALKFYGSTLLEKIPGENPGPSIKQIAIEFFFNGKW